ncbi:hypothetical protein T08_12523 [Trichinella sp. T8]|nr:hypothetical protein T08_12523 [Trichinella sp. T8]
MLQKGMTELEYNTFDLLLQILINYFVLNVKCVFFIFFAHIYICGGGLTALLIAVERLCINCGCGIN